MSKNTDRNRSSPKREVPFTPKSPTPGLGKVSPRPMAKRLGNKAK